MCKTMGNDSVCQKKNMAKSISRALTPNETPFRFFGHLFSGPHRNDTKNWGKLEGGMSRLNQELPGLGFYHDLVPDFTMVNYHPNYPPEV